MLWCVHAPCHPAFQLCGVSDLLYRCLICRMVPHRARMNGCSKTPPVANGAS